MSVFDKAHARPIDRTARRVIGAGESYPSTFSLPENHAMFKLFPAHLARELPENVPDKRGKRRGRMTLVAYCTQSLYDGGGDVNLQRIMHRWIARCDCGNFEVRNYFSWWKNRKMDDRCQECCHNESVKFLGGEGRRS